MEMIVKLSNYDGKYRVVALAKDRMFKNLLLERGLCVLFLEEDTAVLYPEKVYIALEHEEQTLLTQSINGDVFEIDSRGNAYKYYDNASLDNAILVTNKCNSNCIMCPTAEGIRKSGAVYAADTLVNIARYFPSDAPHITITGGEPFLIQKDLFTLLDFLKRHLPHTSYLLLTNGRAFCSGEYVRLFQEKAPPDIQLGIPLHGYTAKIHDFITQARNSFDQTTHGLQNLLAIGARVELRIVVSRLNAPYVTQIAKYVATKFKGVFCVKIIGLEMTGNAAKNREQVWIDYPTAFQKSQEGIDVLIHAGIDVGIYNFPLCAVNSKYWDICEKSISSHKIRYVNACHSCLVKDACGGIFAGTIRLAKEQIHPIR